MAFIKNPAAGMLIGTETDDVLDSVGGGPQSLYGGAGNDLYVIDGADLIVEAAGQGTDTVQIVSGLSAYTLAPNLENAVVLDSTPGNFALTGNELANNLTTAAGNDTLDGGAGNDTLSGGLGNDIYVVDSATDVVIENASAGVDEIRSSAATYTLSANVEKLTLTGSGNIAGVGNALNNTLSGNTGNNTLDGGDGHDTLLGGGGNDSLVGGLGNDSLQGDAGVDTLVGGAGDDTYKIDSASDVVTEVAGGGNDRVILGDTVMSYTLGAEVESLYLEDEDGYGGPGKTGIGNALSNFIMGSAWADNISGAAGNDMLDGGDGADTMFGGLGNDTFVVNHAGDRALEAAGEGIDLVYASVSHALSDNVDNLTFTGNGNLEGWGNALDNILVGNAGDNLFFAGAGKDVLNGGAGADALFGGAGNDTYYFDGADSVNELNNEGVDTVLASAHVDGLFNNVENLTLTGTANLRGYGNVLNNLITGNSGDNTLSGGGGVDTLSGGAGNDTYYADSADSIIEAFGGGADTVFSNSNFTLGANVENLVLQAGAGNVTGTGNADNNAISGNSGSNTIDGAAGNDALNGGYGVDRLVGGVGDDTLNGGAGSDVMIGGAGNDTYYVGTTGDQVDESTLSGGAGVDLVISGLRLTDLTDANIFRKSGGATGTDVIENVRLESSAVDVKGNSLANTVWGNASANVMEGGAGNDTYYVDLKDTVTELGGATDIDSVVLDVGATNGSVDMASRYANVESLTLLGTGNFDVIGTAANNNLVGNAGNNLLVGGGGSDTMAGGLGNDTYQVNVASDVVTELANQGIDTVESQVSYTLGANLENLKLTGIGALSGTGNELNNLIMGNGGANALTGNAGNDTLQGFTGNDTLAGGDGSDFLDGGSGNDAMTGGLGDDTYVVDSATDVLVETTGQGNDTVLVARGISSYTLGATADVETLMVEAGNVGVTFTGNALSNTLRGNAGNDSMIGGGGNDTFDGRDGGGDTMVGGTGTDTFSFAQATPGFNSLGAGDSLAGAGGADVLNATISGVVGAFASTSVETLNFTTSSIDASVDLLNTAGVTRVNVTGTKDFSASNVGAADGLGVPVFQLNDLNSHAVSVSLQNSGGVDALQFDLNRASVSIATSSIETVTLNNLVSPLGGANEVNVSGISGAGEIYVKGVGVLSVTGLDQAALAAETQVVRLESFAGAVELALADASAGSDLVAVDLHNVQGELTAMDIETLVLDGEAGTYPSVLRVNTDDTATIELRGSSGADITLHGVVAATVDASAYDGDVMSVDSARNVGGVGTQFTLGQAEVSHLLTGGSGNDTFTFDAGALDNTDRIEGGAGTDTVAADIDGLDVGTSGALRFSSIEVFNFDNHTSGTGGTAGAGIDGAALGGTAVTLTGSGARNGVTDTLFVNLEGNLDASGYTGDVTLFAASNTVGNTYTLAAGDHKIYGETAFGVRDTFTFTTDFNGKDLVQGYDVDNTAGGDVLNATLDTLSGTDGQLQIEGVETLNFTVTGANTIDASGVKHAATINLTGAGSLVLSNLDNDGVVLDGSALTDDLTVTAGNGADSLEGSSTANNVLDARGGNDTLLGGSVADTLLGGTGDDYLAAAGGDDSLVGDAGNDLLVANAGNDTIDGGSGFDRVSYADAAAAVNVNLATGIVSDDGDGGADTLSGIEAVTGSVNNDVLTGSSRAVDLHGLQSDLWESFEGGAGNDTINGGSGDSFWDRADYSNAGGAVTVDLGAGATSGAAGIDALSNIDAVRGSAFSDSLVGGSNSASFNGSLLESFEGGAGNDTIDGSAGFDIADYRGDVAGVIVNLAAGQAQDGWGGTDTLINVEMVRGSNYADVLIGGNAGNNAFEGFEGAGGDDVIDGGSGFDRVDYRSATAGVTVNLQTGVALDGLGGTDALYNIEGVAGSDANDSITGSDSLTISESFRGLAGNDTINGGLGANDQVDYFADFDNDGNGLGVVVNLGATVLNGTTWKGDAYDSVAGSQARDGWGGIDVLSNIENVAGSIYNDVIVGSAGANLIRGDAGDDYLNGGAGNDTLEGGLGDDEYYVDATLDVVNENASAGTDKVYSTATFTLAANIENLALQGVGIIDGTGNALANIIDGNSSANVLSGMSGADTINGGGGNDTVNYSAAAAGVTVDLASNQASDDGFGFVDQLSSIENVRGSAVNDLVSGDAGANKLEGLAGNDTLDGGLGVDTLVGGAGNDVYDVDNAGDVVTENVSEGTDLIRSAINWALAANVENLTLLGSGNVTATGNLLNNTLTGNIGNNTLDGSTGNDTLIGGDGNDTYVVDSVSDVVTENAAEGSDLVQASVTYTLSANVEDLTLTGIAAINGTGNALGNIITGNAAINTLNGGAGDDTLVGGAGGDVYVVDSTSDVVVETASLDVDLVQAGATFTLSANVENLTLTGSGAIDGTGNTGNNVITGNSGNNVLNGGAGIDTLIGGLGDDTYVVDSTTDVITEAASAGTDTVQSSVTYSLTAANVENLTLTGSGNVAATGNLLNNAITGNTGNNTLDGGAGNDTLIGGAGNDIYVVDSVSDIVTENAAEGSDLVQASVTYTLSANVENLTLTGIAAINGTGNALDNILNGGAGINILNGDTGNDTLDGGVGSDTLIGGAGNDTYVVDSASDIITENAAEGSDLVLASASYTLSANVEDLTLTGVAAINGTGNALGNIITGNAGINILNGGVGDDTLVGGGGGDVYVVDSTFDVVTEGAGVDVDLVQASATFTLSANVENLTLTGSSAIDGTGNTGNNVITGNSGINVLDGGAGIDTLIGGLGDDTYVVDSTTDVITEAASAGTDTVQSSVTYSLTAANVENLTLTGSSAINGTGSTSANVITGNTDHNVLNGLAGNDTIDGGVGADVLVGGAGADNLTGGADSDFFVFSAGAVGDTIASIVGDTIADFTTGVDMLHFDNALFTAIGSEGLLAANAFWSGAGTSAAHDADDRLIYDTTAGNLYYDADGNGAGASVMVATLATAPALAVSDIQII